jgi:hypothetical protein
MNESIYYNVDEIHNGIAHNRKIRFRYFEYTIKKERSFRKDGEFYEVSPYALTWTMRTITWLPTIPMPKSLSITAWTR